MIYEKEYKIKLNEVDSLYNVTNKSILMYLENISSDYSYEIDNGIENLNDKNLTWYIVEWNLKVLKRPKYRDTINIKVFTKNIDSRFLFNDYVIYVNNEIYIKASGKYALYDSLNNKVVSMNKKLLNEFKALDKEILNSNNLPKIEIPDKFDINKKIFIRKSDIDMNNHVNNLVYLDYINELINNEEFNNIRILYKKEILYNNDIILYRKDNKNESIFVIKSDDIHMIASYSKEEI